MKLNIPSMAQKAFAHYAAGEFAQAAQLCKQMIALNPNHDSSYHMLGVIASQMGQHDAALGLLTHAIRINGNDAEYHYHLGSVHKQQGNIAEAIGGYEQALKIKPDYAEAFYSLGNLFQEAGEFEKAVGYYHQSLAINPNYVEALNNLGSAFKAQGKFDEAAAQYVLALALNPNYAEAHYNLGITLKNQGKQAEAIHCYERALAIKPDFSAAHYHLGVLLAEEPDRSETAIQHLRRYLALDADDREGAQLLLARLNCEPVPERASQAHMQKLYAARANRWDKLPDSAQPYRGHTLVVAAFHQWVEASRPIDVLDAGCGTGLVGALLRDRASMLDGIDISLPMLQKAEAKAIYDHLYHDDLVAFLNQRRESYDVIVSAATLIHFGDLQPVFAAAANALRDGGLFIFTLFPNDSQGGDDQVAPAQGALAQGGCFAHGRGYVARIAGANHFTVEMLEAEVHEYHQNAPVQGLIVAMRRQSR